MRSFSLLVLACLVFTVSTLHVDTVKREYSRILLEESIASAEDILHKGSKKILEEYVKNVFRPGNCSEKTLSQTAAVLKNTHLNLSPLHRQLYAYARYTGHINESVPDADEQLMHALLKDIIHCCQKINSQKNITRIAVHQRDLLQKV